MSALPDLVTPWGVRVFMRTLNAQGQVVSILGVMHYTSPEHEAAHRRYALEVRARPRRIVRYPIS